MPFAKIAIVPTQEGNETQSRGDRRVHPSAQLRILSAFSATLRFKVV